MAGPQAAGASTSQQQHWRGWLRGRRGRLAEHRRQNLRQRRELKQRRRGMNTRVERRGGAANIQKAAPAPAPRVQTVGWKRGGGAGAGGRLAERAKQPEISSTSSAEDGGRRGGSQNKHLRSLHRECGEGLWSGNQKWRRQSLHRQRRVGRRCGDSKGRHPRLLRW
jgi:hypothetical protein